MSHSRRRRWFGQFFVRTNVFFRPSSSSSTSCHHHHQETATILHSTDDDAVQLTDAGANSSPVILLSQPQKKETLLLSEDHRAATKIQACFRGHLARRAFGALRSLVKLQALVRGVSVRRQARIAMHFMHALARLQVTVRARQLLAQ